MDEPLYDFVMRRMAESPLTYAQIGAGAGVAKRTVEKIARREIKDPGVSHIDKLAKFFRTVEERQAA